MDDLLRDFLTESNENLQQLDQDVVALEKNPGDARLINGIFRTIHTIKGTCGFIGLVRLETVAHAAESVLSAVREGMLTVSGPVISEVLAAVDVIKAILDHLEKTGTEPEGEDGALIARLNACLSATPPAVTPVIVDAGAAPVVEDPKNTLGDSSVRVHVDLLDDLMTLVGELVLDRNRLTQLTANLDDSVFSAPVQHLSRVTTDLQEAVMKTRMQPIGGAWTKLPRIVRDLAQMSGKQISLDMVGAETELDRQILQAIADPLTHMIRNSADHGVEMPSARMAAGKSPMGTIRLKAYHEGGHVVIEVSDDGAGISVDRVREKAIERGLVTREAAEQMHDAQIQRFIFEPGFSTAQKLTNVSGRGVGMDVVKTNIEKIGGQVELHSIEGQGTSVRIKIPLTLAIIPALVVTACGQRYAIPQVNLLELVRLDGDEAVKGVEMLHGAPVYRLRGRLLQLVYLSRVLNLGHPDRLGHPERREGSSLNSEPINIVVLQAEGHAFGLVVDGLSDTEEIVVKPVSRHLKHITTFAGASIMGDGRVALILDVPGIARRAHIVDDARTRRGTEAHERAATDASRDRRTVLVVQAGENERVAVDLSRVSRLEEFEAREIEYSRGRPVTQYRGDVIPLLHVSERLGHGRTAVAADARIPVVVHTRDGRTVGLVVDRILDIVEQELVIKRDHARAGTIGAAVIQDRVTDILDVEALVADVITEAGLAA